MSKIVLNSDIGAHNGLTMLFSELHLRTVSGPRGSIEVICGAMFSGKTEELVRRLKRAQIAKLNIAVFKPATDTRYNQHALVSHNLNSLEATSVENSSEILPLTVNVQVVGIDEAQFFDDELPKVCTILANKGIRVIIAGLDMDFKGKPFGPMPAIMAIAEDVSKIHPICMLCGMPASFSYRTIDNDNRILLGEKESYEPRCRLCFNLA